MWVWITVGVAGLGLVAVSYWQTADPSIGHDSALDAVFDSRLLIGLARVVILAALVYLLASICVRVGRGQWVFRAGPLETDSTAQSLVDDQEGVQDQLSAARATIADLERRLAQTIDKDAHSGNMVDEEQEQPPSDGASQTEVLP